MSWPPIRTREELKKPCDRCGKEHEGDEVATSRAYKVPPGDGGAKDRSNLWYLCDDCLREHQKTSKRRVFV
jgi:hypothetical protein